MCLWYQCAGTRHGSARECGEFTSDQRSVGAVLICVSAADAELLSISVETTSCTAATPQHKQTQTPEERLIGRLQKKKKTSKLIDVQCFLIFKSDVCSDTLKNCWGSLNGKSKCIWDSFRWSTLCTLLKWHLVLCFLVTTYFYCT